MDKTRFIECFSEALELDDSKSLTLETEFRNIQEWDSLAHLSVIAMLDEEYGIQIENATFKKLETIGDIVNYIQANK